MTVDERIGTQPAMNTNLSTNTDSKNSDSASSPTEEITPRKTSDLPGPSGWPWLGVATQIDHAALHRDLEGWYAEFGGPYRFKLGPQQFVVFADPEPVRFILQNRPNAFCRARKLVALMTELNIGGVFAEEGATWKKQRRLLMRGFSQEQLKRFIPELLRVTSKLQARWRKSAESGERTDIRNDFECFTTDVTTSLAFGHDVDMLGQADHPLQKDLEVMFPTLGRRIATPFPYWRLFKLPQDRAIDRACANLEHRIGDMVEAARTRLSADESRRAAPETMLEAMIVAEYADDESERFSTNEIYSNLVTLLFAGEDTTAHMLTWLLYFLGQHPECYTRLQAEVDQVLGDREMLPDIETMKHLVYLDALINETHRLKSVVPFMFMQPLEPIVVGGIQLKTSDVATVLMREGALRETAFTEPEAFRPERWLRGDSSNVERFPNHEPKAVLAFGGGARICPGRSLSYIESHAAMTMLARNFDLDIDTQNPTREQFQFTMAPDQLHARLRLRDKGKMLEK